MDPIDDTKSNLTTGPTGDPVVEPTKEEIKREEEQKLTLRQKMIKIFDPRQDDLSPREIATAVVAEGICTFLFVFYCAMTVIASTYIERNQNLVTAFGQGFALALAIYVAAPASGGHLNPAVTIAVFCVGGINFLRAVLYIIAQFVGAIVAAGIAKAIVEDPFESGLGATAVSPDISIPGAFFLEVIMTFFLVFVMYSTAIDPRGVGKLAPLAIGIVVLIDELIGVHWTGASMNPARTLGPQLISGQWDHYWLYFAAPTTGALLAAISYQFYLRISPVNAAQLREKEARKEQRLAALVAGHLHRQQQIAEGRRSAFGRLSDKLTRRGPSSLNIMESSSPVDPANQPTSHAQ